MGNKTTKTFLFFILLLALALPTLAAPPTFSNEQTTQTFTIEVTEPEALTQNQNYTFYAQVFNTSNGLLMSEGGCTLFISNPALTYIAKVVNNTPDANYIYSFYVASGNFTTLGHHNYIYECNTTTQGGFYKSYYHVTTTGVLLESEETTLLLALMIGGVFALMLCSFLFAYLYVNSDNLNKLLRLLYLGASLLLSIAAVSVVNLFATEYESLLGVSLTGVLGGSYSLVLWCFRIILSAWLIYLVYSTAMALLGKREDTYLDDGKG